MQLAPFDAQGVALYKDNKQVHYLIFIDSLNLEALVVTSKNLPSLVFGVGEVGGGGGRTSTGGGGVVALIGGGGGSTLTGEGGGDTLIGGGGGGVL